MSLVPFYSPISPFTKTPTQAVTWGVSRASVSDTQPVSAPVTPLPPATSKTLPSGGGGGGGFSVASVGGGAGGDTGSKVMPFLFLGGVLLVAWLIFR